MAEHRNPDLENKAVFTSRSMIAGIPSRVFVAIVVLSSFAIFVNWMYLPKFLGIPLSVMLVLIIFIPAYLAHKDDPDAYVLWIRSLFASSRLTTRVTHRRTILVLAPGPGGVLTAQPTSKGSTR
ncbi:hypothetical protein GIV96_25595 [Pseudomonas syringae]|uniref:hypothetical protein n=1 Tax=Pseudomonas syringae TaxID=317 RepID=UPI001F279CF9|nr:hypothetical protein [Pseudomonas syringae]MCF5395295.1 hypothetical protein [Pseudomonas syringae]MCF5403353.1 hypothetical protein [Pseudomonas syringae]